jgi:hypothetical protein
MTSQDSIDILRALPGQVEELVLGLPDDALRWRPSPEDWSILEVCSHLRDSLEIDGERIRLLLGEADPLLRSYDQEALARERNYQNESMPRVLTALRAFSGGLAYLLENLGEEQWQRTGRHEERGPMSVAQYAQLVADHVRVHLEQIRALRGQLPPGR